MRTTRAYASLKDLDRPIVTTGEAAARLRISETSASRLLSRLALDGLVLRIRRGLWAIDPRIDPYQAPTFMTAPFPSYVSTWSALYHHGMINQVPREIYVVSLDRTKRVETPIGNYVIQHLRPELFKGYETHDGVTMAVSEKALFDTVYLLAARGKRYIHLPELEIPKGFRPSRLGNWIRTISPRRLRVAVADRIDQIVLSSHRPRRAIARPARA